MGENSAIEWCDHTFNPWEGCQKVGPGCDHCYAESRNLRFAGGANWGPGAPRRRTSVSNWAQPRRWNRRARAFRAKHGYWPRVFCASLADVFDNAVPDAWRRDLWELIRETPDLRWILLTKRVGNIARMLPFGWLDGDFEHVGLMITVVDQAEADRDVPKLLDIPIFGRQWFGASHEPALGPVDWANIRARGRLIDALIGLSFTESGKAPTNTARLSWIICGGESGPEARPMHPDWARADRDNCADSPAAFLFKQWGSWFPQVDRDRDDPDWRFDYSRRFADGERTRWVNLAGGRGFHGERFHVMGRVGKAESGRLLDGCEHLEFPEALS